MKLGAPATLHAERGIQDAFKFCQTIMRIALSWGERHYI